MNCAVRNGARFCGLCGAISTLLRPVERMAPAVFACRELCRCNVVMSRARSFQALPTRAARFFGAPAKTTGISSSCQLRTVGNARVLVGRPQGASPF